jgi:hypothetical protein
VLAWYTTLILPHPAWCQAMTGCLLRGMWKKSFGYNYKIMIIDFKSRHLVLWLLKNLWSVRVWIFDWLYKGKIHYFQCILPKINCIVLWLFFYVMFLSVGFFLKSKIDLSFWENLYFIGLELNCSKARILELHLFLNYN